MRRVSISLLVILGYSSTTLPRFVTAQTDQLTHYSHRCPMNNATNPFTADESYFDTAAFLGFVAIACVIAAALVHSLSVLAS